MIIPVFKQIGETTHSIAKKIGDFYNTKATHTGTLDPMASGVIVVLTDEDRLHKSQNKSWNKVYQFEILVGFSTDSHDLLGLNTSLINKKNASEITEKNLSKLAKKFNKILPKFVGKKKQKQPKFSAQRVGGKSGFELAKKNQNFELTENLINVKSLKLIGQSVIIADELENIIEQRIKKVQGNFRQQEIIEIWKNNIKKLNNAGIENFPTLKFRAEVSKRTYIRAFVRDFGKTLNIPMTTYSIIRTNEGPYSITDCKKIEFK